MKGNIFALLSGFAWSLVITGLRWQAKRDPTAGPLATVVLGNILTAALASLALLSVFAFMVIRSITPHILGMTNAMAELANGNLKIDVPGLGRLDEIGSMAKAVQIFKDNGIRMEQMKTEQEEIKKKANASALTVGATLAVARV